MSWIFWGSRCYPADQVQSGQHCTGVSVSHGDFNQLLLTVFSFPQALERFLSSIKTSSDLLLSGMSHCWADLCRGTLLGAVLDQVVWPVLHRVMERFLSPPTIPDRPQVLHQYKLLATNFSDDLECLELSWVLPATSSAPLHLV